MPQTPVLHVITLPLVDAGARVQMLVPERPLIPQRERLRQCIVMQEYAIL
jgi:hypothetical protein